MPKKKREPFLKGKLENKGGAEFLGKVSRKKFKSGRTGEISVRIEKDKKLRVKDLPVGPKKPRKKKK